MDSALSPEQAAAELADLLERQHALYDEVLDLSRQQAEVIASGDTERLLHLLADKQKRIGAVETLARQAHPLQEICERAGDALPAPARQRVETALAALREALREIVALEDQGQSALAAARDSSGGKIMQMQKGKMLHKAYGGTVKRPSGPHFQDRNG